MTNHPKTDKVTAKIYLKGLMLMCINKAKHCEMGFIPCGTHIPVIKISEVKADMSEEAWDPIEVDRDMYIKVINPKFKGVKCRKVGNTTDFSYVPDIEGKKLHKDAVEIKTNWLIARVGVTDGELYSEKLYDYDFELVSWTNAGETPLGKYGKLVKTLCLDAICKDVAGSGIHIIDNTNGSIIKKLPKKDGITYRITVDSTCEREGVPEYPTDFRLFYTTGVVKAKNGMQFDFKPIKARDEPSPEVCQTGQLGKKSTLGLSLTYVES